MQSSLQQSDLAALHVAVIMDGNGRWAVARGRPRAAGHRAWAAAVRRAVEAAAKLGIGALTLYAFSSDNWQRPAAEVATLFALFETYLRSQEARCARHDIRLTVVGRRDRLPSSLRRAIERVEAGTSRGTRLHLRLAVDYSSRDAILAAARLPDVDLLIRTGGERRLSDFLLWESAYAELLFLDRMWPDFTGADLRAAVFEYSTRERRFGGIPEEAPRATSPS
jgi:undecaprenyl diphosphate synthase